MLLRQASTTFAESAELPRLVQLGRAFYGAAFSLMKLLPARFMLERAEQTGQLGPDATVIETSSGTFALGLAIVCRSRGWPLIVVGDPAIDANLRRRLTELGARVNIVSGPVLESMGVQQARLARVQRLCERHPAHYVPHQYDNPMNAAAYGSVAELLVECLGQIDCLVGSVGSGGSSGGMTTLLRTVFPRMRLVGVDTPGSVVFGAKRGPRLLRGLGSSLLPGNVRHELFDEVHWVGAAEAFLMARQLYRRHALFMGATSGATYLVGRWLAAANPDWRVVALMPDEGHRYQQTIYNDAWLRRHRVLLHVEPVHPVTVEHPHRVEGGWTRMSWDRRSLPAALRGDRGTP